MTRPDGVLVERVTILAALIKALAMVGVAVQPAGPGGPHERRRDCGCQHHGRGVFFSAPESGVGEPFVRVFDAQPHMRLCRKVPPPRGTRWEDACLSTGIAGE